MRTETAEAPKLFTVRLAVFGLASTSFACLLGAFYGLWTMRTFACFVYLPAGTALTALAWARRGTLPARWIVQGALAGLLAAVAYDLFRLPFVLNGAPLFKVFPRFGELLLGFLDFVPGGQFDAEQIMRLPKGGIHVNGRAE